VSQALADHLQVEIVIEKRRTSTSVLKKVKKVRNIRAIRTTKTKKIARKGIKRKTDMRVESTKEGTLEIDIERNSPGLDRLKDVDHPIETDNIVQRIEEITNLSLILLRER